MELFKIVVPWKGKLPTLMDTINKVEVEGYPSKFFVTASTIDEAIEKVKNFQAEKYCGIEEIEKLYGYTFL